MKRRKIVLIVVIVAVLATLWIVWNRNASITRVALVNFQRFQITSIVKANTDRFVRYEEVLPEDFKKLRRYDFVLGFGMGIRITEQQRNQIKKAAGKGTPVLIYAATNPENSIDNLDSIQSSTIAQYLNSGSRRNYQSLARYIRRNIDGKRLFAPAPDPVVAGVSDVLYHLDDEVSFETVGEYEKYLRDKGFYNEGGAVVAVLGGLNNPFSGNRANIDSLIVSFHRAGMNIYPVLSMTNRMKFLREINPDAVIYFAHGRLAMGQADAAVEWLAERNIPIFAPLSMLQTQEQWEADPMGMSGGFMSQSMVVPELDGAIYPYVINTHEIDDDGLYLSAAIPDRLKDFTSIVSNFTALKQKSNSEKKIAIYYFKGAGQQTLAAQGLETIPSLYNLLKRLRSEGYKVDGLPSTEREFEKMLMSQGAVLSTYAQGAFDEFLQKGKPALIEKTEYESWIARSMPTGLYDDVVATYGEAPGAYMNVNKGQQEYLAVARIELGNIALLPQPMAGLGGDAFAIVHGTKSAPPHTYIAAYLWSRFGFEADAIMHFGTHGSLEFTPSKQVALSSYDWPDRLVGTTPHFYYYTIGNIGESMMAKRRSYATIVSYLTPAFMESNTRTQFKSLEDKIAEYWKSDQASQPSASVAVKKIAVEMGLHRELRLDSLVTNPYSDQEIERIENFAQEIINEKMTGQLYTSGEPYPTAKIHSSVMAMSADPIAYSLAALDRQAGKVTAQQLGNKTFFARHYLDPAKILTGQVLEGKVVDHRLIGSVIGVSDSELKEAHEIVSARPLPTVSRNISKTEEEKPSSSGHPSWIPKSGEKPTTKKSDTDKEKPGDANDQKPSYTAQQRERAHAMVEVERTIKNIVNYRKALEQSPEMEFRSILNALSGGYISPSSGGDAVANPLAVPTGRNLYAINAEATPSESAWEKGVSLVKATLDDYIKRHGDYPRKVSYTFWSSEFIETEGATIAQVLYMLGVEPVRDAFGRVSDIQLIPSQELERPRIDVVVQTSGQFRDLAASRLALISRAVEMASNAPDDEYANYVTNSTVEIERQLVDQGIAPGDAREMSTKRVFGGVNGMYGTGIQEMVTSGDKWDNEKEIADTYIHNVGAVYGSDKDWGDFHQGLLRAVLHNTDVVVQPRQSNTWGALSLDHVFEFMGGMNLAVRNVTGKDPDAYFADYRNRHNVKMQELKEAIGVESRATIFNPSYIKEVIKGKASSAAQITEVVTNTYGWNVMKPDVIDNQMWDEFYEVYIKDKHGLGVQDFYRRENPAAMQEITAVMMESARKGMWRATDRQLAEIANLHTELVREFGPSGSGMAGSNAKLQEFIAAKSPQNASGYKQQIDNMQKSTTLSTDKGMVLKKETPAQQGETMKLNGAAIVGVIAVMFVIILVILRRRRRK